MPTFGNSALVKNADFGQNPRFQEIKYPKELRMSAIGLGGLYNF